MLGSTTDRSAFLLDAAMRAPEGLTVLARCTDDRLQRVDPIAYMPGVIARAGERQPTTSPALAQPESAFSSVALVPHPALQRILNATDGFQGRSYVKIRFKRYANELISLSPRETATFGRTGRLRDSKVVFRSDGRG